MNQFGAQNLPESQQLRALLGALRASPTGNNLLLGQFVLPRAAGDPARALLKPGDGLTVFYVAAGTIYLALYAPETGWQRVALAPY